jgi:plastocyanin
MLRDKRARRCKAMIERLKPALRTLPLAAAVIIWALACRGGGEGQGGVLAMGAGDFYFKPQEINARPGQPVTLRIVNEGKVPHTFTIKALGVDVELRPGEERTVTFTPTGEGEFVCRFHEAQGMKGRVVAAAQAPSRYRY